MVNLQLLIETVLVSMLTLDRILSVSNMLYIYIAYVGR